MAIERGDIEARVRKYYAEGRYARPDVVERGRERVAVYTLPGRLTAGTVLQIGPREYRVEREAYLVFIDLMHLANFAHPVVYELHDANDGSVTTIDEEFPLSNRELEDRLVPLVSPKE